MKDRRCHTKRHWRSHKQDDNSSGKIICTINIVHGLSISESNFIGFSLSQAFISYLELRLLKESLLVVGLEKLREAMSIAVEVEYLHTWQVLHQLKASTKRRNLQAKKQPWLLINLREQNKDVNIISFPSYKQKKGKHMHGAEKVKKSKVNLRKTKIYEQHYKSTSRFTDHSFFFFFFFLRATVNRQKRKKQENQTGKQLS